MAKSVETSSQFKMLPQHIQDLINQDMMTNGSADNGATPFSFSMSPGEGIPRAVQGTVFKDDMPAYNGTVGPLTVADVMPERPAAPEPKSGALSAVMEREAPTRPRPLDFEEMLQRHVPKDDSSRRYLALAAALTMPTRTGSFGETMHNVASAMMQEKDNQQKLRAQYTPLIMQQIAAQQTREEQAAYRMEAQQQALIAQRLAAQQAQQGRMDLAAQNQAAMNERAAADRASREAVAAEQRAGRLVAQRASDKPPSGYAWGPADEGGQPTLQAVKGGPADQKQVGALNADIQALSGATSSFDRLSSAANQVLTHPGLPGITGLRGVIPNVPGSAAADAQSLLGTLKSQVAFGVLQDMKNQSKTGGALGAVSEKELAMLQSNLAALDKAQSLEQFQAGLKQVIDYAEKAKDRMREAYNMKHGDKPAPQSAVVAPRSVSWGDLK